MIEQGHRKHRRWFTWSNVLFLVFVLVVEMGLLLLRRPPVGHGRARDRMECSMLARATTSFHFEYGHRPPAASMRSVRMHAWIENKHFNFAKFDLDPLIELDDAERVVFWLGGPAPETDFGFDLRCLYDFEESRLVDRDADGFWEYTSWYGGVYEYDPETKRISSDFSEDASVCRIDPSGIVGESSPAE